MTCPYCGRTDCPDREKCAEYARRTAAQDRAGFEHFTRGLPIKDAARDAELDYLMWKAKARYAAMSPAEKDAQDKAQRESFVRGMMPTGDPRFD